MKKEKLIEELNKYPDGTEVCLCDIRMNLHHDYGNGSDHGLYSDFEIEHIKADQTRDDSKPFIAINFENDDYASDGTHVYNDC